MVPTFLIDSPTCMLIGAVCALVGRRDEAARRRWLWRALLAVTVFLGTAMAAYAKGPDWMWMYFLDPPDLGVLDLAFMALFLYYLPTGAGFALALALDRVWPDRGAWLAVASATVSNVYVVGRLWDRYFHVGTRAEYLAGDAIPLTGPHHLQTILNLGGAALGVTAVVLVALAVKEGRAAAPADGAG